MSLTRKIASNILIHTIGKFGGAFIGLFIIGLLTRYLGTEGYGYYTTIFAYLFFFATLGDLGLYLIVVNELGREGINKQKVYSNIFTMRFVSGLFFMTLASILVWFFPYPFLVKLGTLIIAISVFFMTLDQVVVALFQERMQTKFVALAELVGKIVILLLTLLVIKLEMSFICVLWTVVFGMLAHFLINFFFARRLLKFSFAFDQEVWQEVFKKSWPVATYMVFSMIYFKADTIVLSLYHSQSIVGIYGAPYKILEVLIAFPAIFMGLVTPHLSKAFSLSNLIDFQKVFQKAFDFLGLIIWPMIFGTLVLAQPIINLITGQEFLASAPVLRILIIATGIIFLAHLSTFAVVAINKQKQMMKFYLIAGSLALVLYFIFIPQYSYWAAAIITVLIEFFILISSWLMVKRNTQIRIDFKNNLISLLASLIMAFVLWSIKIGLLPAIIIGALIYLGGLYIFGLLRKELVLDLIKDKE